MLGYSSSSVVLFVSCFSRRGFPLQAWKFKTVRSPMLLQPRGFLAMSIAAWWILVGMCIPPEAWAGSASPFPPPDPEELKIKSELRAPGAPAIILFRQVDRDDRGQGREDVYLRIKILTDEGRRYANVEIPFHKETEKIGKVYARTVRPDGSIVEFQGKPFDKEIVKAKGLKYLSKT